MSSVVSVNGIDVRLEWNVTCMSVCMYVCVVVVVMIIYVCVCDFRTFGRCCMCRMLMSVCVKRNVEKGC